MKLTHICMLSLAESGKLPLEHDTTVYEDVMYEIQTNRTALLNSILNDQLEIKQIKRDRSVENIRKDEVRVVQKYIKLISTRLFDNFHPINISEQIWREYFFNLYDLIVPDFILLNSFSTIKGMIESYDLIKEPEEQKTQRVLDLLRFFKQMKVELCKVLESHTPDSIQERVNKKYESIKRENEIVCSMMKKRDIILKYSYIINNE